MPIDYALCTSASTALKKVVYFAILVTEQGTRFAATVPPNFAVIANPLPWTRDDPVRVSAAANLTSDQDPINDVCKEANEKSKGMCLRVDS